MRIILYIFLIFLSLAIEWQLGLTRHGIIGIFIMFTTIIIGANYLLNRKECLVIGVISLFLGLLLPPILWTYGEVTGGDTSDTGMLGTILMIIFAPVGISLLFIVWRKND